MGGELYVFGVVRVALEPVDLVRFFERPQRQVSEMLLQNRQSTLDRTEASESRRFDAALPVRIEERGGVADVGGHLRRSRRRPARIATCFDFADEHAFPIARFFHRLDRALFARLHSWNRKRVHRHAVPPALPHHVEHEMPEAASTVRAAPFSASSSDTHGPSFIIRSFRRSRYSVGAPRLIQSSTSRGWKRRLLTPKRCETSRPRQ